VRLRKVIKKEFKEFIRDKGFLLTIILEPLIIMIVFGYAFQADITDLNTIVIDEDGSAYSNQVLAAIDEAEVFKRVPFNGTIDEAKEKLRSSEVRALFYISKGFGNKLDNAEKSEMTLFLDSSDYTIYNILRGSAGEIVKTSLNDIVQLLVQDLEEERDEKQHRVDEIDSILDTLEVSAEQTKDDLEFLSDQSKETRDLLNDTENKINDVKNEIGEITTNLYKIENDLVSFSSGLSELRKALENLKTPCPTCASSLDSMISSVNNMEEEIAVSQILIDEIDPSKMKVSPEHFNIGEMKKNFDENEEISKRANATTRDMQTKFDDIIVRMDGVHLELKTLKKEFLSAPLDIRTEFAFGEISYFQYLTPAIMSLILFFIGVMLTMISIVSERNAKTLFRISTTPLKRVEMYAGKFVVFFAVGIVEAVYVLVLGIFMFDVIIVGSIVAAMFVLMLLMAASIGLGLLISSVVKSMRQATMMGPLVVLPAILISQTFSPVEVMPQFMRYVAYMSPLYYSNVSLREIMIKGTELSSVWVPVLILGLYAAATLVLGVMISKKRIE